MSFVCYRPCVVVASAHSRPSLPPPSSLFAGPRLLPACQYSPSVGPSLSPSTATRGAHSFRHSERDYRAASMVLPDSYSVSVSDNNVGLSFRVSSTDARVSLRMCFLLSRGTRYCPIKWGRNPMTGCTTRPGMRSGLSDHFGARVFIRIQGRPLADQPPFFLSFFSGSRTSFGRGCIFTARGLANLGCLLLLALALLMLL